MEKMEYKTAIENLRQYNREYSKGNELLESVVSIIDYIFEDSQTDSKKDLIQWAKQVKKELLPKVIDDKCSHCDYPHI